MYGNGIIVFKNSKMIPQNEMKHFSKLHIVEDVSLRLGNIDSAVV